MERAYYFHAHTDIGVHLRVHNKQRFLFIDSTLCKSLAHDMLFLTQVGIFCVNRSNCQLGLIRILQSYKTTTGMGEIR